jgi:hypothetical protein
MPAKPRVSHHTTPRLITSTIIEMSQQIGTGYRPDQRQIVLETGTKRWLPSTIACCMLLWGFRGAEKNRYAWLLQPALRPAGDIVLFSTVLREIMPMVFFFNDRHGWPIITMRASRADSLCWLMVLTADMMDLAEPMGAMETHDDSSRSITKVSSNCRCAVACPPPSNAA